MLKFLKRYAYHPFYEKINNLYFISDSKYCSSTLPAAKQLSTLRDGHINKFEEEIIDHNGDVLSSILTYYVDKANNIWK